LKLLKFQKQEINAVPVSIYYNLHWHLIYRKYKAESRKQKAESRKQKAESRKQTA
jgi:hypothetical protein